MLSPLLTQVGDYRLSTAVISHASRAQLVSRLRGHEPGLRCQVLIDGSGQPSPGSALGNVLQAWRSVASGATHHLVLQDDVTLCQGFLAGLAAAIDCAPSRGFSLFSEWGSKTAQVIRIGALTGAGWAEVADPWLPAPAVLMPARQAGEFAEFLEQRIDAGERRDAFLLLAHLQSIGQPALVSVPNLVQHDDPPQPSLLPNGKVRGPRRTACYLGDLSAAPEWSSRIQRLPGTLIYHSPHDLVASALSQPDPGYQWQAEPVFSWLGRRGFGLDRIAEEFAAARQRTGAPSHAGPLGHDTLIESWLGAFGTGASIADERLPLGPRSAPVRAAALATMAAGPYRRVLADQQLSWLSENLPPLLEDALERAITLVNNAEIDPVRTVAG
ncbi:MAG: hypothetical protein ACR2N4_03650 [Jatrophihabitans sp.]